MKNLLLLFVSLILTTFTIKSQTLIAYDYIENWSWGTGGAGWSVGCGACGYYTNVFVTSTSSAALIGAGNGSSPLESGTYILTNITGLSNTKTYKLKFRAGSYKIYAPSAATAGNDMEDYFDVQYSSNNSTYTTEMRISGRGSALWNYNTNATAAKTANGSMTTYSPTGGGDRTTTGDGYSVIELTIPAGVTQLAFRIPTRSNSAGEEWWFDNFELWDMTPVPLPVELISFSGDCDQDINYIIWKTASEYNTSHFDLEKSRDGYEWNKTFTVKAAENSNQTTIYNYIDSNSSGLSYYRLQQYDNDGEYKTYGPISIDCQDSDDEYFTVFPNPSDNTFSIILNNDKLLGDCVVTIVDEMGRNIFTKDINVKTGINLFTLEKLDIRTGFYYIFVSNDGYTTNILKQMIK